MVYHPWIDAVGLLRWRLARLPRLSLTFYKRRVHVVVACRLRQSPRELSSLLLFSLCTCCLQLVTRTVAKMDHRPLGTGPGDGAVGGLHARVPQCLHCR